MAEGGWHEKITEWDHWKAPLTTQSGILEEAGVWAFGESQVALDSGQGPPSLAASLVGNVLSGWGHVSLPTPHGAGGGCLILFQVCGH